MQINTFKRLLHCVGLPLTIFSAAKCIVGKTLSVWGLLQMGRAAQVTPHFSVPPSIPQPPWPLSPSLSIPHLHTDTHTFTHRHTQTHTQSSLGWAETVPRLCSNAGCRALVKWDYHRSYAVSGLEVDRGVSWGRWGFHYFTVTLHDGGRRLISNMSADAQASLESLHEAGCVFRLIFHFASTDKSCFHLPPVEAAAGMYFFSAWLHKYSPLRNMMSVLRVAGCVSCYQRDVV